MQQQLTQARSWYEASTSQLWLRATKLEAELSSAMALLELRERQAEACGERRSSVVTEHMAKWRELIAQKGPAA